MDNQTMTMFGKDGCMYLDIVYFWTC